MKFKIVAEDKGKIVNIPITSREVSALQELQFFIGRDMWNTFKLNKIENDIASVCEKFSFLGYDVKDGGRSYSEVDGKFRLTDERHYLVKKPRWHNK